MNIPIRALAHETEVERRQVGPRREPAGRGDVDSPHLLLVDHLERIAEATASFFLHLDDEQPLATPENQVELVPPDARVRRDEPIPTKPVVDEGAALAAVHAASTEA